MSTKTNREINELLALGTYQGMTDEEIAEVVEYKAQQKYLDYLTDYHTQMQNMSFQATLTMLESRARAADDMLESVRESVTQGRGGA